MMIMLWSLVGGLVGGLVGRFIVTPVILSRLEGYRRRDFETWKPMSGEEFARISRFLEVKR